MRSQTVWTLSTRMASNLLNRLFFTDSRAVFEHSSTLAFLWLSTPMRYQLLLCALKESKLLSTLVFFILKFSNAHKECGLSSMHAFVWPLILRRFSAIHFQSVFFSSLALVCWNPEDYRIKPEKKLLFWSFNLVSRFEFFFRYSLSTAE